MKVQSNIGYSKNTYLNNLGDESQIVFLAGSGIQEKRSYDRETKTWGDVNALQVEVYYRHHGALQVKLPPNANVNINDLSPVKLIHPEAFVNDKNDIYVRAQGLEAMS